MQTMRRQACRVLLVTATLFGVSAAMAGPATAGPCYTVTIENGSPNPPAVTVCPYD